MTEHNRLILFNWDNTIDRHFTSESEKEIWINWLPNWSINQARKLVKHLNEAWRATFECSSLPRDMHRILHQFIDNLKRLLVIFSPHIAGESPGRLPDKGKISNYERPMWNASLSSMWAIDNFPRLRDFFAASERLGFACFELNHQVNSPMLAGIDLNSYQISSIHAPCPADISEAELKARDWLISSIDEDHRDQGVRAVKRSIDLARDLHVSAVIVHPGNVHINPGLEKQLRKLFSLGEINSPEADELRQQIRTERGSKAPAHLEAVRRSLGELAEYSASSGVRLGLENRYHLCNIPYPDEMGWLLEALDPEWVGFWYDVGHAQTLDRLGFFPHETWLGRFADRMIGAHLHDVRGIDDHYAPGLGDVDWSMIGPYIPQGIIRTAELRPHNTSQQIQDGMQRLFETGLIQYQGNAQW